MTKRFVTVSLVILLQVSLCFLVSANLAAQQPPTTPTGRPLAQESIDSLLNALKTGGADEVGKTQEELARIGRPASEPLYALVREENARAKDKLASSIAAAIGGNVSQGRRLQQEAREHDKSIARAFQTLAKIGSPAADVLLKALNDGERRYRTMVLDSLVATGDRSVVRSMKEFADKEPSARDEVLKAVEKLEARN